MVSIGMSRFVGREQELDVLLAAHTRALTGRPQVAILSGEAGAGKSRLCAEIPLRLPQASETRVLYGACLDLSGGGIPFAPFAEALRVLPMEPDWQAVRMHLGPTLAGLERVAPGLLLADDAVVAGVAQPDPELRGDRLFELVSGALQRIAQQRPLVLLLEDLHWADQSTLDLLVFLVANARSGRLLVVVTFRSDELGPTHPLRRVVAELSRRRVDWVELDGFSAREVALIVEQTLGYPPEPQTADRLLTRSDGNPYFLEELVAAGALDSDEHVPRVLHQVVLARVRDVSGDARNVLSRMAVLGRSARHELLAAICSLPPGRLNGALRELVDAGVVLVDRQRAEYRYRHWLTQHAVYSELLPGERTEGHAAAARALSVPGVIVSMRLGVAVESAHHWMRAGRPREAFSAAVWAGIQASTVQAYPEARRQFEIARNLSRALDDLADLVPDGDWVEVLMRASEAERWAGEIGVAIALLKETAARPEVLRDPERAGLVQGELAKCLWDAGEGSASLAAWRTAARLLSKAGSSAAHARALAAEAGNLMLLSRYKESLPRARQAVAAARTAGIAAVESHALSTLGVDLSMLGELSSGETALRDALLLAEQTGSFDGRCRCRTNLTSVLEVAGRLEEAAEVGIVGFQEARSLAAEVNGAGAMVGNAAWALFRLGRWDQAERLCDEVLDRLTGPMYVQMALTAVSLSLARGDIARATQGLRRALKIVRGISDPQVLGPIRVVEAEVALCGGDSDSAEEAVRAGSAAVRASEDQQFVIRLAALGLRALGDHANRLIGARRAQDVTDLGGRADSYLTAAMQAADQLTASGAAVAEAPVDLWEAVAERTRLTAPEPAAWEKVVHGWRRLGQPYRLAYALFRLAESFVDLRRPTSAAEPAREAYALCVGLGEQPLRRDLELLARLSQLKLSVSGPAEPVPPRLQQLGLTNREQQVLHELALGCSNRHIARRLFISEKTASVHVSNILAKLGVASRTQAAALTHRMNLFSEGDDLAADPS